MNLLDKLTGQVEKLTLVGIDATVEHYWESTANLDGLESEAYDVEVYEITIKSIVKTATTLVIPEGITKISIANQVKEESNIKVLKIPSSVKYIVCSNFKNLSKLEVVKFGE